MIAVYPHDKENDERLSIFLAGTIDNGDSENWQVGVQNSQEYSYKDRTCAAKSHRIDSFLPENFAMSDFFCNFAAFYANQERK